ncbi:hypothetical protein ACHAQJ_001129 [Trichoderma viride]
MPRKFVTQDVKDQNRESQRRSRARRNELVNDLKKQVESYQRQGASASLEMQKVAQAVTFENQCLRSLLSIYGVSQDDIQQYISSPSAPLLTNTKQTNLYEPRGFKCRTCGSTSIVLEKHTVSLSAKESCASSNSRQTAAVDPQPLPCMRFEAIQPPNVVRNIATETDATVFASPRTRSIITRDPAARSNQENLEKQFHLSHEYRSSQYHPSRSYKDKTHYSDTPLDFGPSLSMSPHGLHHVSESVDHIDAMETSCDTAASILVDLHHHADAERARVALGCKGPNSCTVNNIKIFQLLEKFP